MRAAWVAGVLSGGLSLATGCGGPRPGVAALPACAARSAVFVPEAPPAQLEEKLKRVGPRLDELLHVRRSELRATGAVLGVVLGGRLVHAAAAGVRDAEPGGPPDADTVFRLGALTKSFTALALLRLRDAGALELDSPVTEHLPELRWRGLAADAPSPTLRQLLTMTSGLPDDDAWPALRHAGDEPLWRALRPGLALSRAPGDHAYSNLGYALLGRVIERVSGRPFTEHVTREVLQPLGMAASAWHRSDVPEQALATGYRREGGALVATPHASGEALAPASGLYSSLRDYARYMAFQLAAYPPRAGAESGPVCRATLREMHAGQRWGRWASRAPVAWLEGDGRVALSAASYGFGWVEHTTCEYEGIVQHGGHEPGYFSHVRLLPEHGLGVAIFSTTAPVGDYATFERVLAILADGGLLEPRAAEAGALEEAFAALVGLLERWDERSAEQLLDPWSREHTLAGLKEAFAALRRAHGRCAPAGAPARRGALAGNLRLRCQRGGLELHVGLTPTLPPRVQTLAWTRDVPPGERLSGAATQLASAIAHFDEAALTPLLDPSLNLRRVRNAFERLELDHGACSVDRPVASDGATTARFRLRCTNGPIELAVALAPGTGRVARVSVGPAGEGAGTCSQERVIVR